MLGNSNRLNITLALLGSCSIVCANNSEGIEYFETHIRPLFIEHCYECHSAGAKELKANLSLDSRTGWETGGDSGPAIIPGEPEDSLLLHAVSYSNSDLEMPPKNRLPASKIKHLKSWIAMGAPDPRESKVKKTTPQIDLNKGRQFWSFQPPVAYPIPKPRDLAWPNNNIDRFILAQLENQNITPARGASKTALLRRIYFDLIGLPPSPDELRAFLQDKSPQAFQTIVANLLARPEFGERWGRHWLDITRFAESSGGGRSLVFPDAWRFRDYVIDSFNKDKPYHQIVREHLAGDLLPHSSHIQRNSQLIGSGYLVLGALNYELQDHELLKMEFVDEQIDTVGRTFLGMTLGCARCHDHKFDPIPTSDYYALAGIFQSTRSMGKGSAASGVTSFATTPLEITNHAEISRLHSSIGSLKKQIDTLKNSPDLKNFPGLVIDSNEAQLTGNWKKSTASKPWIGKSYLHDENAGKGEKKAQFTTIVGETRDYEVLVAYSSGSNRAKNVPVTIHHAEGKTTVIIDQSERPSIWETFTSVGTFPFSREKPATIVISNEKTTAHVIADAVAFIAPNSAIPQKPKTDLKKLESRHKSLLAKLKKLQPVTMAPTEAETIADGHVHIRGQVRNKGAKVPRGFLTVASQAGISHEIPEGHSGRLELAEWITNPQHPLTSRVMVNRIWKYLLGEGIVRTVDNFGKTGELPSHPKLLDHLAIQFTKNNWSIKSLIREIVLSKTYQLSSKTDDNSDPENRFFGRAHRKRLEAEAIRDTALHLSGQFDPIRGGPTIRNAGQYDLNYDFDSNRRSIYVPWFRNSMLTIFEVFDAPNPNLVVGRRSATNLPTQALFLMNSPFMREQSKLTAKRLLAEAGTIEDTYLLILSRPPSESELLSTQTFLDSFSSDQRTEAWTQLTQALFLNRRFSLYRLNLKPMIDRRQLLKSSSCGFGSLALSSLLGQDLSSPLSPKSPVLPARAKRIIFLFMAGGPSHVDSFDYKPELIKRDGQSFDFVGVRKNTFGKKSQRKLLKPLWDFKQHGQSGRWVSSLFPHIAKHVDDLCFIHSMHTEGVAHGPSTLFLHTGATNLVRPSIGSWVTYGLGTENENLPGFVTIMPSASKGGPRNYSNAFLPAIHQGTCIGRAGLPASKATIRNLKNPHLPFNAQSKQFDFLQQLNRQQAQTKKDQNINAAIDSFDLAFRMQMNAPDILDLAEESEATKSMYGIGEKATDDYGRQCLMARRLAERGVRFIQVNYSDESVNPRWDQHSNMPKHKIHAHATDQPVAGLLKDLKQRGLLEDTLVWWGGEFGRTPFSQGKDGRDHNPRGFTTWLAGGGTKPGHAHGATDEVGDTAVSGRLHMHDLHATMLHLLGLDHEQLTYNYAGRDFRLTDVAGKVEHGVIGLAFTESPSPNPNPFGGCSFTFAPKHL